MIYEHLISIPTYKVRAFVKEDSDGNHHVFYNDRHSYETLLRSSKHEKDHIDNGDFDRFPEELR